MIDLLLVKDVEFLLYCLVDAIRMEDRLGQLFISETKYGPMVHAKLGIAEENWVNCCSGETKGAGIAEAEETWLIIDGPPG